MPVSEGDRFGLTRWSDDADPVAREHFDDSHAALELKAAGYIQDVFANRPAAAAANTGFVFYATDTAAAYYSTGALWVELATAASVAAHA
ncbi:MAG TPA: hypothetical protein VM600_10020, partial [Actinomycetota bacterium]|nr:hypothetical protein [Actinomycetota bacterium]